METPLTIKEQDQLRTIAKKLSELWKEFTMDFWFGKVKFNNDCKQSEFDYWNEDAYKKI